MASTDNGLCSITLPNKPSETLERCAGAVLLHDEGKLEPYLGQLAEYLSGRRKEFTCPIDLRGTPFQIRVWRVLIQIPFGVVKSYSEVATSIEHLTAVRAVGAANRANPIPIVIPCHRVIGKTEYSPAIGVAWTLRRNCSDWKASSMLFADTYCTLFMIHTSNSCTQWSLYLLDFMCQMHDLLLWFGTKSSKNNARESDQSGGYVPPCFPRPGNQVSRFRAGITFAPAHRKGS